MQVQDEYGQFCGRIKQLTGIDLGGYKERQMRRRLESQMARRGIDSFFAYYDLLSKDAQALQEFLDRVTINVSEFFRNAERWQVLAQKIIPALERSSDGRALQIWSAACSTGEEPYSLAMLLRGDFPHIRWQLLATDLDRVILERARQAEYSLTQLPQVPERFRKRFLLPGESKFRVDSSITASVELKQHDLLREPFPERQDLIVCRNVMIYFTEDIKDRLYRSFSASLRPGGVLFVGSTEQIFRSREYGLQVMEPFFYQKIE